MDRYDLYKLFRTTRGFSNANFRAFLRSYLAALPTASGRRCGSCGGDRHCRYG